jgi:hypothetical protein
MAKRSTNRPWGWLMAAPACTPASLTGALTGKIPHWLGVGTVAIATVLIAAPPVAAGQLNQWRYNEATQQLDLTLSSPTTPRYFLLAQPARIVVDLPNTQLGQVPGEQITQGAVKSVRVSQFQPDLVRVVLELAPETVLAEGQVALQQTDPLVWAVRPLLAGEHDAETAAEMVESPPMAIAPPAPTAVPDPLPLPPTPQVWQSDGLATAMESTGEEETPEEADGLPPLEPGAIVLNVQPPATEEEAPQAEAPLPDLNVPSLGAAIAPLSSPPEAIAETERETTRPAPSSGVSVEVREISLSDSEHRYDPTAPVLDATVPTPTTSEPVLDGTRPSMTLVRPSASATSPEAALSNLLGTEAPANGSAVAIPTPANSADLADSDPGSATPASPEPLPEPVVAEPVVAEPVVAEPVTTAPDPSSGQPEAIALDQAEPSPGAPAAPTIAFGQPIAPAESPVASPAPPEQTPLSAETAAIPASDSPTRAGSMPTTLTLQYPGTEPLALTPGVRQDVLLLQQPWQDEQGRVLAEAGSPVIGRFETNATGSKFVIQAIALTDQNIRVAGESQPLATRPGGHTDQMSAGEGTAFDPATLFSGAANRAAASASASGESAQQIVIQPGQVITVQIVDSLASR